MDKEELEQQLKDTRLKLATESLRYQVLYIKRKEKVNQTNDLDQFVKDTIELAMLGVWVQKLQHLVNNLINELKER